MRERETLADTSGDRHRPVDSRRDQPIDTLGACEPFDSGLILCRDDRPAVGIAKSRRGGVAVDCHHVQVARTRGREQPKLGRPRA